MILRAPALRDAGEQAELRAVLEFEDPGLERFELVLGVPARHRADADASSNPLVPLATLLAARTGEDLVLEAPVSPTLLDGARRAGETFGEWWGYRVPGIAPDGGTEPARR